MAQKKKDLGLGKVKAQSKKEAETVYPAESFKPAPKMAPRNASTKKKAEVQTIDPRTIARQPFENKGKNPKRFAKKN